MKIKIGSYNEGLFDLEIKNNKLTNLTKLNDLKKVSYINNYKDNIMYLYLDDSKKQYIKINNQDLLLNEGACHISYDSIHNLIYTSFYGDGLLKVLSLNNEKWEISETFSYGSDSRVHYASYIDTINMVGVCDLGLNKLSLHSVNNGKLVLDTTYEFNNNEGPRHFSFHKTLPIIYVLNELKPSITVLEYSNNKLNLLQTIELESGAGSAIRISNGNKYIFAAVRFSNIIYSFSINEKGLLKQIQEVQSYGDHPRDFNLLFNDTYLLAANMFSDNLTLYSIKEGNLTLLEKDFYFDSGCSILEL